MTQKNFTDTRVTRVWLRAFKKGFDRAPPQLVFPADAPADPVAEELLSLLAAADLRLLEEPDSDSERT